MAIPHASYQDGGSFNEETYNKLTGAANAPSYSCCAFARYIYKTHNGKETGTSIAAKADIATIPAGSILKTTGTFGTHWMIVGSHYKDATNGDGFYVYDANWVTSPRSSSPYAVRYKKMTYTSFKSTFTIATDSLKP